MSSLLLWKFPTVGIHSFGNQSTQNVFLKIIVLRMSLVLLFYPFRPYSGNASFLFGESAHLTFLEAVTEGKWSHVWQNWGWWKVWHQCFTTLELLQTRDLILLKFFWNEKTTSVGRTGVAPKCLKVILRKYWHDGLHVAAYCFCGARLVMPSNDCRGGLCQQLLREMMESGKTAEWETRRSTLRRHRDSNSVTQPDGWPNLLADGPAERQKWGIMWVFGIMD